MKGVKSNDMKIHAKKLVRRCLLACLVLSIARCASAETDADCWNFDTAYAPATPVVRTAALSGSLDTFAFLVRTVVLPFEFQSTAAVFILTFR